MRKALPASALCLFLISFTGAAATLITGTPNNSDNATDTPTGLTPQFGTLINFDSLTPKSLVASTAFSGSGVSSISDIGGTAPLSALPYSSQSYPNYLGPADFSNINTLITLTADTKEIGIGLLAGLSNSFILQVFGDSNNLLGSFNVTVPSTGVNADNGYYAIFDSSADLKSLEITGDGGIDDLQFLSAGAASPEPSNFALFGVGLLVLSSAFIYRRNKNA